MPRIEIDRSIAPKDYRIESDPSEGLVIYVPLEATPDSLWKEVFEGKWDFWLRIGWSHWRKAKVVKNTIRINLHPDWMEELVERASQVVNETNAEVEKIEQQRREVAAPQGKRRQEDGTISKLKERLSKLKL